ncbi:MAG: PAS domain S-box protein [Nitrospiraceae bacterium]
MITSTSDCSILIVDDDPDIAFTLQELLEHDGYQVEFVGTGTGALSKTKDRHYNAVILDLGLPDMDGLEVLESLQRLDPTLPVIILTAFTNSERTVGSLMQGAFHYLTKPYNRDELRATLRRAVGVQALAVKARQVEHALNESEERFRAIVQSASDAIVVGDGEGVIVSCNRAAAELFGYEEDAMAGRPLTILMPARYRDAHSAGLQRLKRTGESHLIGRAIELHGLKRDGAEFPLELSLATWTSASGRFFSGIIRDITERKRAEEALRISEERLELAVEGSSLGLWDSRPRPGQPWSSPDTPVWWSERLKALLGFDEQEFPEVLESWTALLHPEDKERVFGALTSHINDGHPYDVEYRLRTKRGEFRWFRARGQATWDSQGRFMRMAGTLQCVTDRKRAEEALRESEEMFRQLAEHIREVFWLSDPEKTRILYVSPAYETIWGRSCGSLYAYPGSWIESIHPEDQPRVREAAVTKQVRGTYDETYRIIRPDRSIRMIRDRAFPICNRDGRVYRVAGLAEDITERTRE